MENLNHCVLCKNQLFDIKIGTKCNITKEIPSFWDKCTNIKFGTKYKERIQNINIEYERIKSRKILAVTNSVLYFTIGLCIMLAGYFLGTYAFDTGVISTNL